jgi:enamine deaminase RidA (YjgF/YER057c/UK114 family)
MPKLRRRTRNNATVRLQLLQRYLVDKSDYLCNLSAIGQAWRDTMGRNFPTMAVVQVVALMEDRAKIEIQAHAVLPV